MIVRALKEGKICEPRLDFKYGKKNTVYMTHNARIAKLMEAQQRQEKILKEKVAERTALKKKQRLLELTVERKSRANKFKRLVERSKDQFGFYTLKSRELIARYAMIVMEEERGAAEKKLKRSVFYKK